MVAEFQNDLVVAVGQKFGDRSLQSLFLGIHWFILRYVIRGFPRAKIIHRQKWFCKTEIINFEVSNMWLDRLKKLKEDSKMSSKQIAEAAQLPLQTVKHIFCGDTESPRVDTLRQIVSVLGGSLDDLFAESSTVLSDENMRMLQEEVTSLKIANEKMKEDYLKLSAEYSILKEKNEALKDQIIDIHQYYMRKNN